MYRILISIEQRLPIMSGLEKKLWNKKSKKKWKPKPKKIRSLGRTTRLTNNTNLIPISNVYIQDQTYVKF